ncbi:unnamed protein product [Urochloa decumbens]
MICTIRQFILVPPSKTMFILVLMALMAQVVICSFKHENDTDRLSLLEFKKAISLDTKQALMSWNDSNRLCSWEGVMCSAEHPHRVSALNLTNRGLVGQISPSLGNLTFLKVIILAANSFTGEIPPTLGQLIHLQNLNLNNNTLQGRIPSLANCSKLRELRLYNNKLAGPIPADLSHGLQRLILGFNYLTGIIPASLANITTLHILSCEDNNIEGSIPSKFAKLSGLQMLYMGMNKLSGRFPQAVLNLSNLVGFSVAGSDLNGDLPSNIGNSLPNLKYLYIEDNFFHGPIPSSLANAAELINVDISRNMLTGVVPGSIGKLSKLSRLNLELNKLQASTKRDWEFMNSLANCTQLQGLSLTGNLLEGNVPNSLANLSSKLQYLYLATNQLSGDFPSGIAKLGNLISVALSMNRFTGTVPEWLGTLTNLQMVSLSRNLFTGDIPPFTNMSQLEQLYLDSNQFDGHIPPILGSLKTLGVLNISNNNLSGSIPKELFRIPTLRQISLSFNNLGGPLHPDIGNAKQLTYLQLSSNKLSGEIPTTLGDCQSLEDIKLDRNVFRGSIPSSLGSIRTVKFLNLSHNNLTGLIPPSFGRLQLLEQLHMSFNNLEGEVPAEGIFKNATALGLDGNKDLCGGPLKLHLPPCPAMASNSAKHQISVALKVVIPVAILVPLSLAISVLFFLHKRKQKTKSISLPSFGREFPKVSYTDIARATEGFSTSNLIGKGRYGSVYKGSLSRHGNFVAIKIFNPEAKGAQQSFVAECNALRNVRHRNIVPILTACSSIDSNANDFRALVYKFMPQGDLHNLMYFTQDSGNSSYSNYISLGQRLSILVGISDALAYLHHNNQKTIVHCDLKPSNILLDDDMKAHLGDFGLARIKFHSTSSFVDTNSTSSLAIMGTIGYLAPEYAEGGQVSTATDVYSFGVVLLEIFIRRRPTDEMFKEGMSIAKFTEINFPDKVLQIVDPQLLEDMDLVKETPVNMKDTRETILKSMMNLGLHCTKSSPNDRISMQEVAAKLHEIRDAYLTLH